ncbi:hypothetical protein M405DRAFT_842211 [Rhizopogon salebrosus TDB-379]|nr:hypothetical protein M405DRAFT_842211 [Rhizopogon salebrosus TDB-379]
MSDEFIMIHSVVLVIAGMRNRKHRGSQGICRDSKFGRCRRSATIILRYSASHTIPQRTFIPRSEPPAIYGLTYPEISLENPPFENTPEEVWIALNNDLRGLWVYVWVYFSKRFNCTAMNATR